MDNLRDHFFLGMTQSLCPECLDVVSAKIVHREGRVYFQKFCPRHGEREDFVCSDVAWFDRMDFNVPGRSPIEFGVEPNKGCPYDCGLCTQHEQHTCIAVLEITDSCNLTCPMCYASSGPGGKHLSLAECKRAIDRLVQVEGRAEILQLSGGEPTVHPQFAAIFEYACQQAIDLVMVNTNGTRLAKDRALGELLGEQQQRCHVYLQMDGLTDDVYPVLRGESLLESKLKAIERLGEFDINTTLVSTLQTGVNVDQIGPLVQFAKTRHWITGVSFQPATYVGRCFEPADLENRITFPDVIREVARQTDGEFREDDFFPIPCAHPNSHTLCYTYRRDQEVIPVTRFVDMQENYDLLANGISLTREQSRTIIESYIQRQACGSGCDCCGGASSTTDLVPGDRSELTVVGQEPSDPFGQLAESFFEGVLLENFSARDMFRITTTSFMDVYNFDIRQLMKSCVHHILPSGHLIPFDAYNLLYRTGHVPLPPLSGRDELVTL
ncbi:MAG: radical SAM protein [Mariniblastus sp.]|nr:radical SAM protein [Mariniblastus sp.]